MDKSISKHIILYYILAKKKRTRRCLLVYIIQFKFIAKIALGKKCSLCCFHWQVSVWNEFGNFTLAGKFIGNIWKTFVKRCYKTSFCQVEYFPGTEFHLLTGNFLHKTYIFDSIGEIYNTELVFSFSVLSNVQFLPSKQNNIYLGKTPHQVWGCRLPIHMQSIYYLIFYYY